LSFLEGFLCSVTLGDLSLQYFVSRLQPPLRGIQPRLKLLYLKEKLLICFRFCLDNITPRLIALRSLIFPPPSVILYRILEKLQLEKNAVWDKKVGQSGGFLNR
jgi:hypothetical protein